MGGSHRVGYSERFAWRLCMGRRRRCCGRIGARDLPELAELAAEDLREPAAQRGTAVEEEAVGPAGERHRGHAHTLLGTSTAPEYRTRSRRHV